jgi:hypothetical protein
VAFSIAATACGVAAKMTLTFSRTRSPAASDNNSGLKLVKRYSIARFLPSTYPASAGPRWNAAIRCASIACPKQADYRHRRLLRALRVAMLSRRQPPI